MNQRPLYSLEAEYAVIGAVLLDNAAFEVVANLVTVADFWSSQNRTLYTHIAGLINDGKPADATTLISSLQAADDIEAAGGMELIERVLLEVPSAHNAAHYARIVRDHRIERDLSVAAAEMTDLAWASGPVSQRLDKAQQLIFALNEQATTDEPSHIKDVLFEVVEDLETRMNREEKFSGLSTNLVDLDEQLDGLQSEDLIIIGGRPSMGKTSLGAQIGDDAAIAGKSVLVFSMEMSRRMWGMRSMSRLGRIDSHRLRSGKLNGDEFERVSSVVARLHDKRLTIDDAPGLTVERMRARARQVARRQKGLDLIIVDYLQLMSGVGDNRTGELTEITRGLKNMARELKCPVVALSQLSRDCEKRPNKRPVMADLRDSGSIEQDADVIIFVYRDEVYNPDTEAIGTAELIISKCRMGAIGMVRTAWLGEYTSFENWRGTIEPRHRPARETRVQGF